ncbi:hypothetical protein HAX54_014716 [Datura stramonium]|uniref:NAC domain-containing protein n=1 Tax=Datura stramonium TaxID=4076 RepID=A0ABS8RYY3_DATST|nr:hypothetical protein [Datura stramonium]
MGMNFEPYDDEQLMNCLLKFVCGVPIQCHRIRFVELYGNKKPSELFQTSSDHVLNYFFTQLKKKTGNGKNFNRAIVGGGGSWKGLDNSKSVYDKKGSLIGFKKSFRFYDGHHPSGIHVWNMKEYRLSNKILEALRQRRQIRHEDFVVCCVKRNVNSSHNNLVSSYVPISSSQHQETAKSSVQNQFQENQDFGRSSVIPSDGLSSILSGNSQVSLLTKESNVTHQLPLISAADEECSVCTVHQETPSVSESAEGPSYDIAAYHEQLDAYAATILDFNTDYLLVPYVPQHEDQCPLFCEDFYVGHTALWS